MELVNPTILNLIILVLAIYVGYHVVWNVTPALHTPLMAVTNAVSAIVIVGAMLAASLTETGLGRSMGLLAVILASVNVFGGFPGHPAHAGDVQEEGTAQGGEQGMRHVMAQPFVTARLAARQPDIAQPVSFSGAF